MHSIRIASLLSSSTAKSTNVLVPRSSILRLRSTTFCRPTLRRQYSVDQKSDTTHFGFKEVPEAQKSELVAEVFHRVAKKYDLMNDLMSAGVHRVWKSQFIDTLRPVPGVTLLDVAGGTGDIAFRFIDAVKSSPLYSPFSKQSHVTVCDINTSMLEVGKHRAEQLGYSQPNPSISFQQGDAENLTAIESASQDAYTIAFGIRNCTHVDKVIAEAFRVLRPGGRFLCLEFSKVTNPLLGKLYDEYSFNVIPGMGQVVAGDRESYQYLVESIRKFPSQEKFAEMIRAAGFQFVSYQNLSFGVAAIHSGFKPK